MPGNHCRGGTAPPSGREAPACSARPGGGAAAASPPRAPPRRVALPFGGTFGLVLPSPLSSLLLCLAWRGYGRFQCRSAPGKSPPRRGERLVRSPCAGGEPGAAEGTEGPGSAGTGRGRTVAVPPCQEVEVPPAPRCGAPGAAPGPCRVRVGLAWRRKHLPHSVQSQTCQDFRTLAVKGTCFQMSLFLVLAWGIAFK